MAKVVWKPGTLLGPLPAVMVSCGTMESANVLTVAWTGILNTIPPKTYIAVRPRRYSYNIIKETGEFAINHKAKIATIHTVQAQLHSTLSWILQLRYYGKDYGNGYGFATNRYGKAYSHESIQLLQN